MFRNLITRWLFNRRRMVYEYFDGRKWRKADPLVIYMRITGHENARIDSDWKIADRASIDLRDMNKADKMRHSAEWKAHQRTAQLSRDVFEIPAFDGRRGLTDDEAIECLRRFIIYMAEVKKKRDMPQKSPEPTDLEFSEESTTTRDSESSATRSESKAAAPQS